jgi:acetyl esterase
VKKSTATRVRLGLQRGAITLATRSPRALLDVVARRRTRGLPNAQLDPQLAMLLALADIVGEPALAEPLAAARRSLEEGTFVVDAPGVPGVITRELAAPGMAGPIPLRLYEPANAPKPSPGIVYFHGGGWVLGNIDAYDAFCSRLAALAHCRVVSVEYRLAPENKFPKGLEDARAAYTWVGKSAGSLGIDTDRIGVGGDSAGGNLAAVVARHARAGPFAPKVQLLIYPAVDATRSQPSQQTFAKGFMLTREKIDRYLSFYIDGTGTLEKDPDLSPLFAEDLTGIAPALIYTAGFDPLRDEAHAYSERVRAAGNKANTCCFDDLIHGFAVMTRVSESARSATMRICEDARLALYG